MVPYTAKRRLNGCFKLFCRFTYTTPRKNTQTAYKADLDNLVKALADALQDCGVFTNDKNMVELHATKEWGNADGISVSVVEVTPLDTPAF